MTCPVCQSSAIQVLYHDVADYVTGDTFNVCQCSTCSVAFTAPQPEDVGRYYQKQYRRYVGVVLYILKTLYGIRSRQWSRMFSQPGTVLEVGCGDGYMLNSLRGQGWTAVGIERTPEMAEFARTQLGLEVYSTGVQDIPNNQKFDAIILFQVLEHIAEPLTMLQEVAKRLTPNGKLIIGVPNFDSWQRVFAGKYWFHLDIPRHLVHFSPYSLEQALKLAGMTIERIRYASVEHDPYGWLQSVLNRLFSNNNHLTRILMRMDRPSMRGALSLLFAIVFFIPAVVCSLMSWMMKKGAMMEVVAVKVSAQFSEGS